MRWAVKLQDLFCGRRVVREKEGDRVLAADAGEECPRRRQDHSGEDGAELLGRDRALDERPFERGRAAEQVEGIGVGDGRGPCGGEDFWGEDAAVARQTNALSVSGS